MYLSNPSVKALLIDSYLSAELASAEQAAIWEKAKWECWHVAPKDIQLSSLLRPLILLSSSLLAADDLASDITEKREAIKLPLTFYKKKKKSSKRPASAWSSPSLLFHGGKNVFLLSKSNSYLCSPDHPSQQII